jgi:hypothetical protein
MTPRLCYWNQCNENKFLVLLLLLTFLSVCESSFFVLSLSFVLTCGSVHQQEETGGGGRFLISLTLNRPRPDAVVLTTDSRTDGLGVLVRTLFCFLGIRMRSSSASSAWPQVSEIVSYKFPENKTVSVLTEGAGCLASYINDTCQWRFQSRSRVN